MPDSERQMARFWLTQAGADGLRECQRGNYLLGGFLFLTQFAFWVAFLALAPVWIPFWLLGYVVARVDRVVN